MSRQLVVIFMILGLMGMASAAPATDADAHGDQIIATLTQRYQRHPDQLFLAYYLARFEQAAGKQDAAVAWLRDLAGHHWTLGINRTDFAALASRADFRAVAARLEQMQTHRATGSVAFTVGAPQLLPEGIAYDAARRRFLIGSDGGGYILGVDGQGHARRFAEPESGLDDVLGLNVDAAHDLLYAVNDPTAPNLAAHPERHPTLQVFALADGRLVKRLDGPSAGYLNDLCRMPDGAWYVSDTIGRTVLRALPGGNTVTRFGPGATLMGANGIACDAQRHAVFVAVYDGVVRVDADGAAWAPLRTPRGVFTGGLDGMYLYRGDLIGIQNGFGAGRVLRLHLDRDGRAVRGLSVLEAGGAGQDEPTTGVIVGTDFYYLANSQSGKQDEEHNRLYAGQTLDPIKVWRLPLEAGQADAESGSSMTN